MRFSGCKHGLNPAKEVKLKKISMAEATQLETKRGGLLPSLYGIRAT